MQSDDWNQAQAISNADTSSHCTDTSGNENLEQEALTIPPENPKNTMTQEEGNQTQEEGNQTQEEGNKANDDNIEESCEDTSKPSSEKPEYEDIKQEATNRSDNSNSNANISTESTEEKSNTSPDINCSGEQHETAYDNDTEVKDTSPPTHVRKNPDELSKSNSKSNEVKNKNENKDHQTVKNVSSKLPRNKRWNDSTNNTTHSKSNKRKDRFEKPGKDSKYKTKPHCTDCKYKANSDCTDEFVFFWKSLSPYSQWYLSDFTVNDLVFNCAEQYMMYGKAMLFEDKETAYEILQETDPRNHKSLGRRVQNFDQKKWDENCLDIVKRGNKAKFSQNKDLYDIILDSHPKTLVEASPVDRIWGIGLASDDYRAYDRKKWRGKNLLGQALTEVRDELMGKTHDSTKEDNREDKTPDRISDGEINDTLHKESNTLLTTSEINEDTQTNNTNEITTKEPAAEETKATEEQNIGRETNEDFTSPKNIEGPSEGVAEINANENTIKVPDHIQDKNKSVITEDSMDKETDEECKANLEKDTERTTDNNTNGYTTTETTDVVDTKLGTGDINRDDDAPDNTVGSDTVPNNTKQPSSRKGRHIQNS